MPRGGARPGAGRPKGSGLSPKVRPTSKMIRAAGYRVPDDAPPEMRALADRALQRMTDVMEECVEPPAAPSVLKAAVAVREEVCGPVEKRIQISGSLEALLTASLQEDLAPIPIAATIVDPTQDLLPGDR